MVFKDLDPCTSSSPGKYLYSDNKVRTASMDILELINHENQSRAKEFIEHGNQTKFIIPVTTTNSDNRQNLQSTFTSIKTLRKVREQETKPGSIQ